MIELQALPRNKNVASQVRIFQTIVGAKVRFDNGGRNHLGSPWVRTFAEDDAMVKIAPPDCEQAMAARYQMVLPTEEELRAELARERAAAEQLLLQNQAK